MSAPTRLSIYQDALLYAGERAIATLSDDDEGRYLLDQVWNNSGLDACLEEAQWYFAMKTIQIDYDPGFSPDFGYAHAFDKPTDWLRTVNLASDEFFRNPELRYNDEAGYWFCDEETLYVRYISNDPAYGNNLALWPRSFTEFVACHFASKIVLKLSNDDERLTKLIGTDGKGGLRQHLLLTAKSKSAAADPTQFPAQGWWTKARMRGGNRRDGGNTSGNLVP